MVNGEERDGSYFKIVTDYIHLNPVHSGWVGGETGQAVGELAVGQFFRTCRE